MHKKVSRRRILVGMGASAVAVSAGADSALARDATQVEENAMNMIVSAKQFASETSADRHIRHQALVDLYEQFTAAHAAEDRAVEELGKAEERWFDIRPEQPEDVPLSAQLEAACRRQTMEDVANAEHPTTVALNAFYRAASERREAWRQECERLAEECGARSADRRATLAQRKTDAALKKFLRMRAETLEGVLLKIQAATMYDKHAVSPEAWDSIVHDIFNIAEHP